MTAISDDPSLSLPRASYTSYDYGLSELELHRLHQAHQGGALISVLVAMIGILLAFLMYIKGALNPAALVARLGRGYQILVNKYYMDDLYIKLIIGRGLLAWNRILANFDLGIYDRFRGGWPSAFGSPLLPSG